MFIIYKLFRLNRLTVLIATIVIFFVSSYQAGTEKAFNFNEGFMSVVPGGSIVKHFENKEIEKTYIAEISDNSEENSL